MLCGGDDIRPQPVKCDVVYLVQHRSDISSNFSIEGLEWSVGRLEGGNCMNNYSYSNIGCCTLLHVYSTHNLYLLIITFNRERI